ncbi:uncharacterized protein TNCV_3426841 [Trichonephila clavipes]|nr:uncharacterized protein TNCV_3426841 [Trichonephila clavipes]
MFDPSSFVNPTPLAHSDASRDVLPRGGTWVAWSLEHRTPDRKAWIRCPMPPNTLRGHTEYVLVKSAGPKVLWADSRVQGIGEYFPPLQSRGKIVEVEIGGVVIGSLAELIRTVTCVVLKVNDRRTSSPLTR